MINVINGVNTTVIKHFRLTDTIKKANGFTIIELLITVAIIAILASVAYPAYTDSVTTSNRLEGQRELLRLANLQEQYFNDYRTYGSDLSKLGQGGATLTTDNGKYIISVTSSSASAFVLSATAQGSQATNDSSCSPLTITEAGVKGPSNTGCWD